jgi:uncharacterized membrane protein YraQ (UPF0718 family)
MLIPTVLVGLLALIVLYLGCHAGGGQHIQGMKSPVLLMLRVIPLLFFTFIVAGRVQAFVPRDLVARRVGDERGVRGILHVFSHRGSDSPCPFLWNEASA